MSLNSTRNKMEEIEKRIKELEKRKEMALFMRKITTQLLTVMEYDMEIDAINRKIELLHYDLKKGVKPV